MIIKIKYPILKNKLTFNEKYLKNSNTLNGNKITVYEK